MTLGDFDLGLESFDSLAMIFHSASIYVLLHAVFSVINIHMTPLIPHSTFYIEIIALLRPDLATFGG